MTAEEEWRPVAGFPGYFVSNHGRLMSTRRGQSQVLQGVAKSHGYLSHNLPGEDGRRHTVTLHSLVAEAFLGPRPEGQLALHYDGDPMNNKVENLRWGTRADNYRDAVRHGLVYRGRGLCHRGHWLDESNRLLRTTGGRRCRTCQRLADQRVLATP